MDERDIRDEHLLVKQAKAGMKRQIEIMGSFEEGRPQGSLNAPGDSRRWIADVDRNAAWPFRQGQTGRQIPKADFQFRALRAKASTDKAESSGDILQARDQLGHTTVVMTEQ
ncbi:hypothetical protein [Pseudomonas cavernae]|uniref:hypothetical protein n=1 Tax=Pseudomonas cavernae TaxID=2320867 RepID=UPI003B75BC41